MRDSREITELKERIDCLEEEKAEAERICSNMKESLSKEIGKYKSVSELLSKEQQENESLKERIKELEYKNDELDSQHSKWVDTAVEWQKKCDELEKQLEEREQLQLLTPLETANFLIHDTSKRKTSNIEKVFLGNSEYIEELRYNVDELEQIAEHLLIYCKHNKGCEE